MAKPRNPRPAKPLTWVVIGFVAVLTAVGLIVVRGRPTTRPRGSNPQEEKSGQNSGAPGARKPSLAEAGDLSAGQPMAQQVCGTCHLVPAPEVADRFTWANGILPRMNEWLGYQVVDWANEPGGDQVVASGKVPRAPVVNFTDLKKIQNHYLAAAPDEPPAQAKKPELQMSLKHFRVRKSTYRQGRPTTTLVKIDERSRLLFVGDGEAGKLVALKPDGSQAATVDMPNPFVHLLERPDGFYASAIGSVRPSDLAQGQLLHLRGSAFDAPGGFKGQTALLTELRRPVECAVADLNQDGREDLVVATYGNVLGRFSWREQKPDGSYEEHVLLDRPGAVGVKVHDFDRDGRADIVVTMAQAWEGIWLLFNRGQGRFEERPIVQRHPAWGFSHLETVDFNKDGEVDLLVTNGDNGDNVTFPHCVKPYHGVRLYLNEGRGQFREAWFYPLYGAYRALARDFDLDGDLDIAAIAYFPDYLGPSKEGFTYLENQGEMKFSASTFPQSLGGRWITMDAGDLDGDGDPDIVLGAFNRTFGDVPETLQNLWTEKGPSFLLLENTVRSAR